MPFAEIATRRAVLITGKGGVGKSSVAAAIARAAARAGKRTLCVEVVDDVDEAAPLASLFGLSKAEEEPVLVAPNLSVAALSPSSGHKAFLRDVLPMRMLADAAMKSQAVRRFLQAAPTFPEFGVLYRLTDLASPTRHAPFDQIVVDLPATGHALALVEVPEAVLRIVSAGAIGQALKQGLALLCDPAKTSSLVVTLPEPLPVSEALELSAALAKRKVAVAGIILNRVPHDPFNDDEFALACRIVGERPTLGGRSVSRLERTRASRERLRSTHRVFEISEHSEHGETDVVARIADAIAEVPR